MAPSYTRNAPPYALDDIPGSLPTKFVPGDVNFATIQDLAQRTLEHLDSDILHSSILWRDWFALTGQIRTINGVDKVAKLWNKQAKSLQINNIKTKAGRITKPIPTGSWVDIPFTFTTHGDDGLVGNCTGVASFIMDNDGRWKIWMLVTVLDNFADLGHPDVPPATQNVPVSSGVANGRINVNGHGVEDQFDVVVLGAGQCGLSVAGRLAALGISYVLLEKRARVGHNWINRYESVRQHTVREYNNLPFERTWTSRDPDLLPGKLVANGFDNWIKKHNINLWTNADTTEATWDAKSRTWTVSVSITGDGEQKKRTLVCRHLIIATGAGVTVDNDPKFPGTEKYKGILVHSGSYKHSRDWIAKDAIVVGTGTMAHDIAEDMYRAGLRSVTMIQRNKTAIYPIEWVVRGQAVLYNESVPTTEADYMVAARPNKVLRDILATNYAAFDKADSARLDALSAAGFNVDRTTPMMDNILTRYGGYYIDIGTSSHIARGEIKIKSGVTVTDFTEQGVRFSNGEEMAADVVVVATGQDHDYRNQVADIVGRDVAKDLGEFWGLDQDGEVRGVMKPAAPGLWMFGGTAAQARWWSRFVALAVQSDVVGKPLECVKLVG